MITKVNIRRECSERTMEYYDCIMCFLAQHRVSPSASEVADLMGVTKTAAVTHIKKLIRNCWIEVDYRKRIRYPEEWIISDHNNSHA